MRVIKAPICDQEDDGATAHDPLLADGDSCTVVPTARRGGPKRRKVNWLIDCLMIRGTLTTEVISPVSVMCVSLRTPAVLFPPLKCSDPAPTYTPTYGRFPPNRMPHQRGTAPDGKDLYSPLVSRHVW